MAKSASKDHPDRVPTLSIYITVLNGIQDQIRFADTKAGFIAALNALLFGFLVSQLDTIKDAFQQGGGGKTALWFAAIFFAIHVLFAVLSVGFVVWSVMPRFGKDAPRSKAFFGHIAKDYRRDFEKYVQETIDLETTAWARDLGKQIVEVSAIAQSKHDLVNRGAVFTIVALCAWALSFAFTAFL